MNWDKSELCPIVGYKTLERSRRAVEYLNDQRVKQSSLNAVRQVVEVTLNWKQSFQNASTFDYSVVQVFNCSIVFLYN